MPRTGSYYRTMLSSGFDEVGIEFITQIIGNALFIGVTATFEFGPEIANTLSQLKQRLSLRVRHPMAMTINVSPLFEQQGMVILSIQKAITHGRAIVYEDLDDLTYRFEYVVCSSTLEKNARVLLRLPETHGYQQQTNKNNDTILHQNTVFCTGFRN